MTEKMGSFKLKIDSVLGNEEAESKTKVGEIKRKCFIGAVIKRREEASDP